MVTDNTAVTDNAAKDKSVVNASAVKSAISATEIKDWITNYLADLLEVEPDSIDTKVSFDYYGLDSATAVGMTGDLEEWLSRKLDPMLLYDYPTVDSFSRHVAEEL